MKKTFLSVSTLLLACSLQMNAAEVDFEKEIKPILESRCVKCHGEKKQKGDFRLDNAADLIDSGDSAPNVVAGAPGESYLVELIAMTEDDDDVMPPKGGVLEKAQVDKIKQWIAEGAKWPEGVTLEDKSPKKK